MSNYRVKHLAVTTLLAALVFSACAAVFTFCFNRTYMIALGRLHQSINQTHLRIVGEVVSGIRQGDPADPLSGYAEREKRTFHRLYAYGVGSDFHWQWERPGNNMATMYRLTTFFFVLVSPPVAFVLLRFARARLRADSLDEDDRTFQFWMLMRLMAPLLLLAAAAGALAAAGLVGTRVLQISYQPNFNDNTFAFPPISYDDDYLGRGVATLISCAAMLAIVTWGIYPFFARRTLRQLGRCAKCAYPRGDNTTCPECGSALA